MLAIDSEWAGAMRRGDHLLAWALCERALAEKDPATRDDPSLPYHLRWVWDGTPPHKKHVLVRCYHGLGDCLQFARYLPLLAARAASVTVEVPPRLACLFGQLPCRTVPFDPARPLPASECDIEIMELAFALREPPCGAARATWLRHEAFEFPRGTIGLCVRAGDWDPHRCAPAQLFTATALQRPCIALDLGRSPVAVINPGGCPDDIAATAAFVAGCNVVVTVDTMIAHLAGALGKPVLLMLRDECDWRWTPERGTSEWYPTFQLFAQERAGEWGPVVEQVEAALGDML